MTKEEINSQIYKMNDEQLAELLKRAYPYAGFCKWEMPNAIKRTRDGLCPYCKQQIENDCTCKQYLLNLLKRK